MSSILRILPKFYPKHSLSVCLLLLALMTTSCASGSRKSYCSFVTENAKETESVENLSDKQEDPLKGNKKKKIIPK